MFNLFRKTIVAAFKLTLFKLFETWLNITDFIEI